MQRLRTEEGRHGEGNIYRLISGLLTGEEDQRFCLRGNYPLGKKRLRVFMLHTTDLNGDNPTALYEHLRVACQSDSILQYLNTGYEGALEAFTLLECDKADLMV